MKSGLTWYFVALAALVLIGAVYYATQSQDCEQKHGALVRGVFGYACVAAAR